MPRSSPDRRGRLAGASSDAVLARRPGPPRRRCPPLAGPSTADLVVVGGGYLGCGPRCWPRSGSGPRRRPRRGRPRAAGRQRPQRRLLRASLTHGFANGLARWPEEMPELLPMGRENLDGIEDTVASPRHRLRLPAQRASWTSPTPPHQVTSLREMYDDMRRLGQDGDLAGRAAVRARIDSPTYLAGMQDPDGGDRRAGPAGLGTAARLPRRRRADPRAHPGHRADQARGRRDVAHDQRRGRCGRTGGARHQRFSVAAAPAAADDRARSTTTR